MASLAVALPSLYAERVLFDSERFADRARIAAQEPAVRAKAAERISDSLLEVAPDLIAVEPLVRSAAEAVIASETFGSLLRTAAREAHEAVFDRERDSFVLTSASAALLLVQVLEARLPAAASDVPAEVETTLVSLSDGPLGAVFTRVSRTAQNNFFLAWAALGLAALSVLGAAWVAADRRLLVLRAGVAAATIGALLAGLAIVGRALAGAWADDALGAEAVRAIWDAFLGDLVTWGLAVAASGLVAAAAADSLIRPVGIAERVRQIGGLLARPPARPARRSLRALALVAIGVLVLAAPDAALRLVVLGAGVLFVAAGAEEILRLTARPVRPGRSAPRRLRAGYLAGPATVALIAAAGMAAIAIAGDDTGDAPALSAACNGDERLCDRRLDEVTLAATHNSMSAPREGFLFPNQQTGIREQLAAGVRGLLIDTHLGVETERGVYTVLEPGGKSAAKVAEALGPEAERTALRLRSQIGFRAEGDAEVFLCHAFCELGAARARDAFAEIRDFLVARPGEVVVLSIEDQVTPQQTAEAFEESGLLDLVWKGPVRPLPTLGEMVDRDERVLVMGEEDTEGVDWYHDQFELVQETPFDVADPLALLDGETCRRNRGAPGNPMLLLNHFVARVPPRVSDARAVNDPRALAEHARECSRALGAPPSLLAVDLWAVGDVVAAAEILNRGGG